ncbi:hypothetical protein K9L63_01265 [Candidatus Gracilibacteria bacterium]|nr:hypothetical protein [Candidatus Gracilibacteria bacterium]
MPEEKKFPETVTPFEHLSADEDETSEALTWTEEDEAFLRTLEEMLAVHRETTQVRESTWKVVTFSDGVVKEVSLGGNIPLHTSSEYRKKLGAYPLEELLKQLRFLRNYENCGEDLSKFDPEFLSALVAELRERLIDGDEPFPPAS